MIIQATHTIHTTHTIDTTHIKHTIHTIHAKTSYVLPIPSCIHPFITMIMQYLNAPHNCVSPHAKEVSYPATPLHIPPPWYPQPNNEPIWQKLTVYTCRMITSSNLYLKYWTARIITTIRTIRRFWTNRTIRTIKTIRRFRTNRTIRSISTIRRSTTVIITIRTIRTHIQGAFLLP